MTKPSRRPEVRRAKYAGKHSFNIYMDLNGLDDLFVQLGDDLAAAVRPAAQAAAQVLYDEVMRNVQAIGDVTGNLDSSIYQAYSKDHSGPYKATYHISWNASKAPHGHLVEYGHLQRYASYVGKDGKWHTAVKPENRGKEAPWVGAGRKGRDRKGTQAEKDAWYMPRPGGPIQVPAKAFMRRATNKFEEAYKAAEAELLRRINGK